MNLGLVSRVFLDGLCLLSVYISTPSLKPKNRQLLRWHQGMLESEEMHTGYNNDTYGIGTPW